MATSEPHSDQTTRARSLRKSQTKSEGLVWSVLRAKQVCGLKFRRQHPIGPWITDFACPERMLVVEIDGRYHDQTVEDDLKRQTSLQQLGWKVLRFTDQDVEDDAEVVVRGIAKALNLPYEFKPRKSTGSGMKSITAARKRKM